jgi:hypothetical protein
VPVKLSWTGTGGTGLVYEVQKSTDNGATWSNALATANTTATSAVVQLNQTTAYLFQVRATAGTTVGAWTRTPAARTVTAVQESSTAITYAGTGWSTQTPSGNWAAQTKASSTTGDTATYTFTGTNVAWIAKTFPDRGIATITLDKGKASQQVVNVDLYTASTAGQPRSLMFTANALDGTIQHTLEVKVSGTKNAASTGTRVEVDAFVSIK